MLLTINSVLDYYKTFELPIFIITVNTHNKAYMGISGLTLLSDTLL